MSAVIKRPQTLTSEKRETLQNAFLAVYSAAGSIAHAAKAAGCTRETHYTWMREDPTYPERFKIAFDESSDSLEDEAHKRAYKGSDTLLIFLLKGKKPERFREQWKGELTAAVAATNLDISKLDESEIEHLRQLAIKAATQSQAD